MAIIAVGHKMHSKGRRIFWGHSCCQLEQSEGRVALQTQTARGNVDSVKHRVGKAAMHHGFLPSPSRFLDIRLTPTDESKEPFTVSKYFLYSFVSELFPSPLML